jgi:hypothetical protein
MCCLANVVAISVFCANNAWLILANCCEAPSLGAELVFYQKISPNFRYFYHFIFICYLSMGYDDEFSYSWS